MHAFERLGVLAAASERPGFLGAELQVPYDDEDHLLVTASWASREHYGAWLESPIREALLQEVENLLVEEPDPRVYHVVESVS